MFWLMPALATSINLLSSTHFLAFGFALLVGQGGVGHGSVDVFHLAVQFVELGSDGLVDVVVGGTGVGAALSVEFDIDFPFSRKKS